MEPPRNKRGYFLINNKKHILREGINVIGRNKGAAVIIKDTSISQNQALLVILGDDKHYLCDFNSSNGTYLESTKLQPLRLYEIQHGATVKFAFIEGVYFKVKDDTEMNTQVGEASQFYDNTLYNAETQIFDTSNTANAAVGDVELNKTPKEKIFNSSSTPFSHCASTFERAVHNMPTPVRQNIHDLVTPIRDYDSRLGQTINDLPTQLPDDANNCSFQVQDLSIHDLPTQILPFENMEGKLNFQNAMFAKPVTKDSVVANCGSTSVNNSETQTFNEKIEKMNNLLTEALSEVNISIINEEVASNAPLNVEKEPENSNGEVSTKTNNNIPVRATEFDDSLLSTERNDQTDLIDATLDTNINDENNFLVVDEGSADSIDLTTMNSATQHFCVSSMDSDPQSKLHVGLRNKKIRNILESDDEDSSDSDSEIIRTNRVKKNVIQSSSDETDAEDKTSTSLNKNKILKKRTPISDESDSDTDVEADVFKSRKKNTGSEKLQNIISRKDDGVLKDIENAEQIVKDTIPTKDKSDSDTDVEIGVLKDMGNDERINKTTDSKRLPGSDSDVEISILKGCEKLQEDAEENQDEPDLFKNVIIDARKMDSNSSSETDVETEANTNNNVETNKDELDDTDIIPATPDGFIGEFNFNFNTQDLNYEAEHSKKAGNENMSNEVASKDIQHQECSINSEEGLNDSFRLALTNTEDQLTDKSERDASRNDLFLLPTQKIDDKDDSIFLKPTQKLPTSDHKPRTNVEEEDIYMQQTQKLHETQEGSTVEEGVFRQPKISVAEFAKKSFKFKVKPSKPIGDDIFSEQTQTLDDDKATQSVEEKLSVMFKPTQEQEVDDDIFLEATQKLTEIKSSPILLESRDKILPAKQVEDDFFMQPTQIMVTDQKDDGKRNNKQVQDDIIMQATQIVGNDSKEEETAEFVIPTHSIESQFEVMFSSQNVKLSDEDNLRPANPLLNVLNSADTRPEVLAATEINEGSTEEEVIQKGTSFEPDHGAAAEPHEDLIPKDIQSKDIEDKDVKSSKHIETIQPTIQDLDEDSGVEIRRNRRPVQLKLSKDKSEENNTAKEHRSNESVKTLRRKSVDSDDCSTLNKAPRRSRRSPQPNTSTANKSSKNISKSKSIETIEESDAEIVPTKVIPKDIQSDKQNTALNSDIIEDADVRSSKQMEKIETTKQDEKNGVEVRRNRRHVQMKLNTDNSEGGKEHKADVSEIAAKRKSNDSDDCTTFNKAPRSPQLLNEATTVNKSRSKTIETIEESDVEIVPTEDKKLKAGLKSSQAMENNNFSESENIKSELSITDSDGAETSKTNLSTRNEKRSQPTTNESSICSASSTSNKSKTVKIEKKKVAVSSGLNDPKVVSLRCSKRNLHLNAAKSTEEVEEKRTRNTVEKKISESLEPLEETDALNEVGEQDSADSEDKEQKNNRATERDRKIKENSVASKNVKESSIKIGVGGKNLKSVKRNNSTEEDLSKSARKTKRAIQLTYTDDDSGTSNEAVESVRNSRSAGTRSKSKVEALKRSDILQEINEVVEDVSKNLEDIKNGDSRQRRDEDLNKNMRKTRETIQARDDASSTSSDALNSVRNARSARNKKKLKVESEEINETTEHVSRNIEGTKIQENRGRNVKRNSTDEDFSEEKYTKNVKTTKKSVQSTDDFTENTISGVCKVNRDNSPNTRNNDINENVRGTRSTAKRKGSKSETIAREEQRDSAKILTEKNITKNSKMTHDTVEVSTPSGRNRRMDATSDEEFISSVPKKTKKIVLTSDSEDTPQSSAASVSGTPSRRKLAQPQTSPFNTPERLKRKLKPKVVFTMLDSPELESLIRTLGGSVVDSVDACTVLVTGSVKRSLKLLSAVGQGKPICSTKWLLECKKVGSFLDPWDFILVDDEAERKWQLSLKESLRRSADTKLFDNYTVHLLVNNAQDVLKGAVEACGGKCVTRAPPKNSTTKYVIVSSVENKSKYAKFLKQNPPPIVVAAEAIFDGVLRQELRFENHKLS